MSAQVPLTTLVLRPEPDLSQTLHALRAHQVDALGWESLTIEPIPVDQNVVGAWIRSAPGSQIKLIFVSRNAVRESVDALRAVDPATVQCLCVGNGTAQALAQFGFSNITIANQQGVGDSEQLLALPQLTAEQLAHSVVIIVQGEGGRNLIAPALAARGGVVHPLVCYRRRPATFAPRDVVRALHARSINRLVTYSVESWQTACAALPGHLVSALQELPTFCSHPRVAARLREIGAKSTFVFDGSVEGLLAPQTGASSAS
jgi:uroporphyrinogen-III synthase